MDQIHVEDNYLWSIKHDDTIGNCNYAYGLARLIIDRLLEPRHPMEGLEFGFSECLFNGMAYYNEGSDYDNYTDFMHDLGLYLNIVIKERRLDLGVKIIDHDQSMPVLGISTPKTVEFVANLICQAKNGKISIFNGVRNITQLYKLFGFEKEGYDIKEWVSLVTHRVFNITEGKYDIAISNGDINIKNGEEAG